MNGYRRQYLHTKVRCLTMSALYPAALRVMQTILCAVSCLYEQWWHKNWFAVSWSPGPPVFSVEAWILDLLPSHAHRVLSQGNCTSCTCWALFVWAKSDRSTKLTSQIFFSLSPNSICVKLPAWTSHVRCLSDLLWPCKLSMLWLCTFMGEPGGERGVTVVTTR
jgi:hypothetical protein